MLIKINFVFVFIIKFKIYIFLFIYIVVRVNDLNYVGFFIILKYIREDKIIEL